MAWRIRAARRWHERSSKARLLRSVSSRRNAVATGLIGDPLQPKCRGSGSQVRSRTDDAAARVAATGRASRACEGPSEAGQSCAEQLLGGGVSQVALAAQVCERGADLCFAKAETAQGAEGLGLDFDRPGIHTVAVHLAIGMTEAN